MDFSETIKLLLELFGPNTTLFHKRWKCLNTVKDNQQEFLTFAASVNKLCNDFKLVELTADDFKCLIFAQGLVSAEDTEVRRRVLTKLENEQGLTLQKLAEDCKNNNIPSSTNVSSNHPRSIIKQIPASVNLRINRLSSSKRIFENNKEQYNEAQHNSGFNKKLEFLDLNRANKCKGNNTQHNKYRMNNTKRYKVELEGLSQNPFGENMSPRSDD